MNTLRFTWFVLFIVGAVMIALDYAAQTLIEVGGIPAFGVIGAALILLVVSSMLNWLFKTAWEERTLPSADNPE